MDVLFLKYEDMHADGVKGKTLWTFQMFEFVFITFSTKFAFLSAIKQINDFCGLPALTEDQAKEVVELSTFKSMKKDPNSNYSWLDPVSYSLYSLFFTFHQTSSL